jgi:hypothetical protein
MTQKKLSAEMMGTVGTKHVQNEQNMLEECFDIVADSSLGELEYWGRV